MSSQVKDYNRVERLPASKTDKVRGRAEPPSCQALLAMQRFSPSPACVHGRNVLRRTIETLGDIAMNISNTSVS